MDDTFLGEFSYGGNRRASWVYALRFVNRPTRLAGTTLNLCSQYSALNFYHWMIDGVARLELLQRVNYPFHKIDQILLPQFRSTTADWVIDRLGLTGVKVIHPGMKDQYECDVLVQPSYPGELFRCPTWPIEFFRKRFPAPQIPRTRKLYLPRRGSRGLVNEAAVEQLLTAHGFEAFEPAGRTDLHLELANVSHVVAVHGAAMTNLVFCRPGTRVLELMPSDMQFPFFYSLCSSGQMPYGVVVGQSLRDRYFKVQKATHSSFLLPLPELRSALSALLSSAPSTAE